MMDKPESTDRRKFGRYDFNEIIQYLLKGSGKSDDCTAADISISGLRIISEKNHPVDTDMVLKLSLDGETRSDCKARVVWVKEDDNKKSFEIGLQFSDEIEGED